MGLLDLVFPMKTKFGVAANILSAEYALKNLSPDIIKRALNDVIHKLQNGFNLKNEEEAFSRFLREDRQTQLNVLALAFDNINISPLQRGEYWTFTKNPFNPTIYDESAMDAVKSRYRKTYREDFSISSQPITSEELSEIFKNS